MAIRSFDGQIRVKYILLLKTSRQVVRPPQRTSTVGKHGRLPPTVKAAIAQNCALRCIPAMEGGLEINSRRLLLVAVCKDGAIMRRDSRVGLALRCWLADAGCLPLEAEHRWKVYSATQTSSPLT
jgi:hypothetical protein